jgi:hypothetical protein
MVASNGAEGVTILRFGPLSEFGGPVHGSAQSPAGSMS